MMTDLFDIFFSLNVYFATAFTFIFILFCFYIGVVCFAGFFCSFEHEEKTGKELSDSRLRSLGWALLIGTIFFLIGFASLYQSSEWLVKHGFIALSWILCGLSFWWIYFLKDPITKSFGKGITPNPLSADEVRELSGS